MNIETLIVVVTYNSSDYIENCLNSILSSSYKKWFLSIIDNNSSDATIDKIKRILKCSDGKKEPGNCFIEGINFNLITMKKNTGFAPAVNYAVRKFVFAPGIEATNNIRYLVCVNPDLCMKENTLSALLSTFDGFNDCATAGALIYDYEGSKVQHAGGIVQDNFITSHITELPKQKPVYAADYVTGALFATRLDIFKITGGFDTGYRPVYFEELDYCRKVQSLGFKSYINSEAVASHFEGASSKKFSSSFYRYYHKNRVRCAIINYSFSGFFKKFVPSELKWLRSGATIDQRRPLLSAYFLNFVFLFYNLVVKIKNLRIAVRFKSLQSNNLL